MKTIKVGLLALAIVALAACDSLTDILGDAGRGSDVPLGSTITVTSTEDTVQQDGKITLREAILLANGERSLADLDATEQGLVEGIGANTADPGADTLDIIEFDLPGPDYVITPGTQLPTITDKVYIRGTTQPDPEPTDAYEGPFVRVDGSSAVGGTPGFLFWDGSAGSELTGLSITGFGSAVWVNIGDVGTEDGDGLKAVENSIGLQLDGITSGPNVSGIVLDSGYNIIEDNWVANSEDTSDGVAIEVNSDGNQIISNDVGLDHEENPDGNDGDGINVASGASGNFISSNRVVNSHIGIDVKGDDNTVQNNQVGVLRNSATDLGNNLYGISVGGDRNLIGGLREVSGKEISAGNVIGFTGEGSGNGSGLYISGEDNVVVGNQIGYQERLRLANGNFGPGILITGNNNYVGIRDKTVEYNIIGYNTGPGVEVDGVLGNTIIENRILENNDSMILLTDGGNSGIAAPVINSVSYDDATGETTINLELLSATSAVNYPLRVDFYIIDDGNLPFDTATEEVYTVASVVHTEEFTTSGTHSTTFTWVNGASGADFVASATESAYRADDADGYGGTSEFSAVKTLP